jgi:amino acid adenylation domain-containing protein
MIFHSNLIELLHWRALHQPDRLAYAFLKDGDVEEARLTYAELDKKANGIAAMLQQEHAHGERVLLVYPSGLDYIAAFFGCLKAGAIAVPTYPPRLNRSLSRLQTIASDALPAVALTTTSILSGIEDFLCEDSYLRAARWHATDTIQDSLGAEWKRPEITGETLAFLQYTSGSTGTPKGVMVSNGNLLHNERIIQQACGHTEESTFVGWLPLYHDMGLIGNILQPLFIGAPSFLMSPAAFLQSPVCWLRAITRYRAATSGGPNFAYDLCVRRVSAEQRETLDLSSWNTAFNGAEPIRIATMERFADAFQSCGFRRKAFYPCYGLAEATLFVTGDSDRKGPVMLTVRPEALRRGQVVESTDEQEYGQALVSCGPIPPGQRVVIADPDSCLQSPPGHVGEIWLAGPSVAQGYWGRPQETEETFRARFADTGEGPFLRTGDTGFIREGELFVTGRLKDLIIIRGRNYYPQDIELTVERCHPELRPGCGAAFSIDAEGEELLVVVQEVQRRRTANLNHVIGDIRQAIAEEYELQAHAIVLVQIGGVPKTSSGKVQRNACREQFLEGGLSVVAEWRSLAPSSEAVSAGSTLLPGNREDVESWLRSWLAARLNIRTDHLEGDRPFTRYGIDSLVAVELAHEIEMKLGIVAPLSAFLQSASLSELAAHVFAASTTPARSLRRAGIGNSSEHPLSRGQEALLFLHQLNPASPAYNIVGALRIPARADVGRLRRAFQALVDRHASLRTTFEVRSGKPVQKIHERVDLCFEEVDLPEADEELLMMRVNEEAQRPFDLEAGPLFRVQVFAIPDGGRILLVSVHHIVADFWSLAVLIQELDALYTVGKKDADPTLLPLSLEYVDYVRWQAESLAGDEGEKLWSYWREQLSGELPVLNLPLDRQREGGDQGGSQSLKLSPELTQALKELSRSRDATLFSTLLTGYYVLLHRYTGQEAIILGSPTAGRHRAGSSNVVGYFVNTLPLRVRVAGNLTVETLLANVKQTVLDALDHQDYPLATLVERLKPGRHPGRVSLFQTVFVMQKMPTLGSAGLESLALGEAGVRLGGSLDFESVALEQRTALFDLTLTMAEVENRLMATLQYRSEIFEAATAARMLKHFEMLLEGIVASPEMRVSELPLLTAEEQIALGERWNNDKECHEHGQKPDAYSRMTLHEAFARQARETPDAIAVTFEGRRMTYAELDSSANQLARYLRREGVSAEALVGVMMHRSLDMVVTLLGILKAGGAYVPLDPSYPADRLRWMMDDSRVCVVVTEERFADKLHPGVAAVIVEADRDYINREDDGSLPDVVCAENAAYVIYTSGSTGTPKGVVVTHNNVQRLFTATRGWFDFDAGDEWTMFHSYAFDFSVWELWGALLHGGRLVVVPYLLSRSPETFYELLREEGVTVLNQTPSAFRQLMQVDAKSGAGSPLRLRYVIFGGEALDVRSLRPWFERHGEEHPRMVNMYGITETTVHVTYRLLQEADAIGATGSLIGGPIPDLQLYPLDLSGGPVPIGVVGELYVGGEGLSRGYLGRPDLTADRFVPDPFSGRPGKRLYRTGDLGRLTASSDIEFLGRADDQVKIRGFRIEPGEVEAALLQQPGVREAIVVARADDSGDSRLVAYIVADQEDSLNSSALHRFLKERLPQHMIPSAFVTVDKCPLTINGKIDLRALSAMESELTLSRSFLPPRDEVEEILADVWAEVLGVPRVGIHDNFFEMGGDSIRSIQLRSQALERGLDISLLQIFERQTIAELARDIARGVQPQTDMLRKQPFGLISDKDREKLPPTVEDAYPLTKLQLGLVFHSAHSADYETYITSVHMRAPLDMNSLRQAIKRLVARHEMLRTSFYLTGFSEALQLVHRAAPLHLEIHDLRRLSRDEQERLLAAWFENQRKTACDWANLPLVRFIIHRRSHDAFQFTLAEPFLDGWSVASLLTELFTLYVSNLTKAGDFELPPMRASIGDYVALEREALASVETREYWTEKLHDCKASRLPRLPRALRLLSESVSVRRLNVPISDEVSVGLQRLSAALGVSLKSVLLAAHVKVLSLILGRADVITGVLANGRPETVDGERLLGLFLNAMPFRFAVEGGAWEELIRATFDAELEMLPHRRYPLAELQRAQGRVSLFDTVFNFTHFHVYEGLEKLNAVEVLDTYASEQTYFDLTAQFNIDHAAATFRLRLALDYIATELSDEQVVSIGNHYGRVLAAMVEDPAGRHESLPRIPDNERRKVLVDWNETANHYAEPHLLHSLIESQVARTPRNVAVVFEEEALTYDELNRRANQLAHYLISVGARPETPVGVLMDRSVDIVVGLLAVLKTGAPYLPLDADYPDERLNFMLNDGHVSLVLTQERWLPRISSLAVRVVCVDGIGNALRSFPKENPDISAAPENLAYVIYTSGSTGEPKGATNTHAGICNRLLWMQDEYRLTEADRVLQKTPFSFDVSVWEFFWPLLVGARLIVARPGGHQDPAYLIRLIEEQGVSIVHFVPSMLQVLLEQPGLEACSSLKRVICSGEALPFQLQQRFFARLRADLHNLYGPTEAAVDVTFWRCDPRDERQVVPIGRPISNTQIYILDESCEPVPIGVEGELHIAGANLARDYLNQPGLTATKFIPNPFSDGGARLYKTGDLARYLMDGSIEFLGRIDHQIKLRGCRIELGEIEAVLSSHPSIREAVATAETGSSGNHRLTAYVVPAREPAPTVAELRSFLRRKLPAYMVPNDFITLSALPISANGKLDRRKLPDAAAQQRRNEQLNRLVDELERLSEEEARAALVGTMSDGAKSPGRERRGQID